MTIRSMLQQLRRQELLLCDRGPISFVRTRARIIEPSGGVEVNALAIVVAVIKGANRR
eukprot:CAMPEP_0178443634 /NCGR_PEP_ID=MMETSP0689_2-20121128/39014_1 /TAXON_ID=160604 /ORGANISM="Amphidinium massartii, Strain CS-259" /LENGTH=57 /DNA_ID=CAMNT_0020067683 /DNA_START=321 /DNA_END=494 /DNA_ORIENTATION=-